MKMKKILVVLLAIATCFALASCGKKPAEVGKNEPGTSSNQEVVTKAPVSKDMADVKVGFIFLHDENSTYDKNFMDAAKAAQAALGLSDEQVMMKTNVPEGNECYEAAAEMAEAGCDLVFADSFGHESFMLQAAQDYPKVQFCHATGTTAHTEKLPNFHNAFASIYEGRYLAGIAAGLKLNQMIEAGEFTADEAKMGYVGAFPYAEVISGYTSFYLGAKSVCPSVTMEVKYTSSWFDMALEKEAANALIQDGCKLISQHADSMGAPTACEEAKVPNVSYNGSTAAACPNTAIISSKINWQPYFEHIINAVANGTPITEDYCGGFAEGSVEMCEINEKAAAPGTAEAIEAAREKLIAGTLHVFDTSTFTVDGKTLDSYMADVDTDPEYKADTEVISDGYFHESEYRSAPYFDIIIDGITAETA